MKLLYTPTLAADLSSSYLILDTTVLIHASKSDEFLTLLTELVSAGCTLTTLPSVVYEFTRGSRTVEGYDRQAQFIDGLSITTFNRVEETIDPQMRIFLIAYNKVCAQRSKEKTPSYTDSLLCACAYKYRANNLLIMTANHKDIPAAIFDRKELITIDMNGELHNEAIYSFSEEKFGRVLERL